MNNLQTTQQAGKALKPSEVMQNAINMPAVQKQFQNALGKKASGFLTSVLSLYSGDTNLAKCEAGQVIACALKAAQLDLPIDKQLGFSYIIPYKNRPQFIMGYKGYIQLAMRSGQYLTINTDLVYEGEATFYDKLSGMVRLDGERTSDKVVGYFAYFKLLNGFEKLVYMTTEQMAEYAIRYSPSISKGTKKESLMALAGKGATGGVGWFGDFDSMAKKTCLRQLISKYGILSIEMQNAILSDSDEVPSGEAKGSREAIVGGSEVVDVPYLVPDEAEEATKTEKGTDIPPEEQNAQKNEIKDTSGVGMEF